MVVTSTCIALLFKNIKRKATFCHPKKLTSELKTNHFLGLESNFEVQPFSHSFLNLLNDYQIDQSVIPTHYTFKYGAGENFYCPRNWLFQGSNQIHAFHVTPQNFLKFYAHSILIFRKSIPLLKMLPRIRIGTLFVSIMTTLRWTHLLLLTFGKFLWQNANLTRPSESFKLVLIR